MNMEWQHYHQSTLRNLRKKSYDTKCKEVRAWIKFFIFVRKKSYNSWTKNVQRCFEIDKIVRRKDDAKTSLRIFAGLLFENGERVYEYKFIGDEKQEIIENELNNARIMRLAILQDKRADEIVCEYLWYSRTNRLYGARGSRTWRHERASRNPCNPLTVSALFSNSTDTNCLRLSSRRISAIPIGPYSSLTMLPTRGVSPTPENQDVICLIHFFIVINKIYFKMKGPFVCFIFSLF